MWKNKPTNFGVKVIKDGDEFSKKILGEIFRGIVVETPKDKGTAQANWRVSIGYPDLSTTDQTDYGGAATVAKGLSIVASQFGLGKVGYISNSLRYIIPLNNGWSQQAPKNFVELNIMDTVNKYK